MLPGSAKPASRLNPIRVGPNVVTKALLQTKYAHYIPNMQGEIAKLMDEITSPVLLESRGKS